MVTIVVNRTADITSEKKAIQLYKKREADVSNKG